MASQRVTVPPSPTPSRLPPLPASPVFSLASTANPSLPGFNLPIPPPPRPCHAVLTRPDLEQSQHAYGDLIASAKSYRVALSALSTAASAFGGALEACARLKEARAEAVPHAVVVTAPGGPSSQAPPPPPPQPPSSSCCCTADTLMSAAGVHQLIANHQQILSETVYRSFEVPLLHELDRWRREVEEEEETYRAGVQLQNREIRRMEREGLKLHRQKRRDLARFRAHLVDLTGKLDGLTTMHADHARKLLRESQDTSARILDASCSLVRAEVDIFESLAKKGWTGGGLEDLLERGVDLFAAEPAGAGVGFGFGVGTGVGGGGGASSAEGAKLFSILPPKSILAVDPNDISPDAEEGLLDGTRTGAAAAAPTAYQSLAAVAAAEQQQQQQQYLQLSSRNQNQNQNHNHYYPHSDAESMSVMSATSDFNRPRNARPFSPQPVRPTPTDVTFEDDLAVSLARADSGAGHRRDEGGEARSLSLGETGHGEPAPGEVRDDGSVGDGASEPDEEGGGPWRSATPRRNLSGGEIGKDLTAEEEEVADRGRRWRYEDEDRVEG